MERFLCALIAFAVMFSAATCFGGPFRNRHYQAPAQCENGVCAVPQQPAPTSVTAHAVPHAEAHVHAGGVAKSVLVAPVRGVVAVGKGAAKAGKVAGRVAKRGGGKVIAVGKKILPPYGR